MPKTILYIEDNPDNRLLIKRVLEAEGYQILEADTGEAGVAMISEQSPDLVLLDINLPDIDGYEVAQQIRKTSAVPILALTANVMQGDKERSLAAGCNGYIPKPIDVDSLPKQVEAYL